MNKWRLLLLSISALLHITTSESDFFDGRYGCYAYSPRYLPSDTSFSAYESNRERRFLPEIRQLNPPEKYPTFNVRDTEIVRLSRRQQIRDIKQHSRDNEIRQAVGGQRNRLLTSPSDHIRDKREDFVESSYERSNDLRSNLRHNRLVRDRDTEYRRSIRTASSSRDDYRKKYATRTDFENRDVSRYNSNHRDMLNAHNNNKDEAQRKFSQYDALNTRRNSNKNDMRNGDSHQELDLRDLRIIRSDRPNDNDKLLKDRNSSLKIQRDLYEDRSQRESRNSQRNNVRSLDRTHFSQTNIRSLVRDIENLRAKSDRHQPFDQIDINGERLRSKRSASVEAYLLREDQNNARSVIDKRNLNYNARSTRDTIEKRTSENRNIRDKVGPKMKRVNMATRLEANEREVLVSRFDRRNVVYNSRSTRDTNVKDASENRQVRNNVGPKMNRVNVITRLEAKEREVLVSRFDRRNVNYNAMSTRDTNVKETENREVRNNVGPKMNTRLDNRVNMNTRLDMRERETSVSRLDRRNVNFNDRSTRDTNVREKSENREVRNNVGPKMNRVNMNTRLDTRERETSVSRLDRRNVNFNDRSTRDTNVRETSENRGVRNNVGPKMNRVNMNTRLDTRERETSVSRLDRRNVNFNDRSTRDTNVRETSENRGVRNNVGPKMNRVNMNTRLDTREREPSVSRFDRRNVNFNDRSTRDRNVRETSENRGVRNNVGPKVNRVNVNTRLDTRERETSVSRLDRRNVNYNARSTRDTNVRKTSENTGVGNNVGPKMNRVNMNTRLDTRELETSVSRLDRRNVNFNDRSTRDRNVRETSENRGVRNNVGPKVNRVNMNTRLDTRERKTSVSRLDRRNVNYNARSTRDTNVRKTSENTGVGNNVGPKMNRVNMNTRLDTRELETSVSRLDRRNVNFNDRSTRDTNVRETSENRGVRNNVGPKMNRVNMNTRLDTRERETSLSRFDRRNVNFNARCTRDTNVKETSENREARNNVGPKVNRVNMNTRLDMRERETSVSRLDRRNVNFNARSTRDTNVKVASENREARNNVGPKMNPVNMNTRLDMRERETSLSRFDRRNVNFNARFTRDTNEKDTSEKRYVRVNVEPGMKRVNINTRLEAKEREVPESRFDRRNVKYNARSTRDIIEKRTSENRDENRLFNGRHEARNARRERRQTKMTREDTFIVTQGLVTMRNDPHHNIRLAPVHKLYENLVFEMKWQYLFYALQAVYICSLLMKIPKCNEQNKHTMWIPSWFTLTEYLKID